MVTSLFEAGTTVLEEVINIDIQSYHGLMVFGFFHALKSLPHAVEGYFKVSKAGKRG